MKVGYFDHYADPDWLKDTVRSKRVVSADFSGDSSHLSNHDTVIADGYVNNVLVYAGGTGYVSPVVTIDMPNTGIIKNADFEYWTEGSTSAPGGWTLTGSGATIAMNTTAAQVISGRASAALTRVGNDCSFYQSFHALRGIAYWKGRTVTYGCWVYATVAGRAYVSISDGVTTTRSIAHTGDSTWQLLKVEATIGSTATAVTVYNEVMTGNTTVYFDNAAVMDQDSGHEHATATAVVESGVITRIDIVKAGSGYTVDMNTNRFNPFPTVQIVASAGSGAKAVCYVPVGVLKTNDQNCIAQSAMYIMRDKTLRACGLGTTGRLGVGIGVLNQIYPSTCAFYIEDTSYDDPRTPLVPIYIIGAWFATFVLCSDGSVWQTGLNTTNYELGRAGDITTRLVFNRITPSLFNSEPVVKFKVNPQVNDTEFMMALTAEKKFYRWGYNGNYNLGNGTTTVIQTPTLYTSLGSGWATDFCTTTSCQLSAMIVLDNLGQVWGCGENAYGQLSQGNTTTQQTPTRLLASAGTPITDISMIRGNGCGTSTSYGTTFMLKAIGGTIYSCGYNTTAGQLGNGTGTDTGTGYMSVVNTAVSTPLTKVYQMWINCGSGATYGCAFVKTISEAVYCWGANTNGNLGLGDTTHRLYATSVLSSERGTEQVVHLSVASGADVHSTFALLSNGKIYTCGLNGSGQLGDDSITQRTSWVTPRFHRRDIADVNWVSKIESSYPVLQVLTKDGNVHMCGYNVANVLGDGTVTARAILQRCRF